MFKDVELTEVMQVGPDPAWLGSSEDEKILTHWKCTPLGKGLNKDARKRCSFLQEKDLRRMQTHWQSGLGLPASRTIRKYISMAYYA